MVEAAAPRTVPLKEQGRHLRAVRRRKGLSLSEVARGAGLSRRELVNYERGRVAIPESDLFVIAGSCGVDVSELVDATPGTDLVAAASVTTVGDTVSALRRHQPDAGIAPFLGTLQKLLELPPGKRVPVKERELEAIAEALGGDPDTIDERLCRELQIGPEDAARVRALILAPPRGRRSRPRAIEAPTPEPTAAAAHEPPPAVTAWPAPEPPAPASPAFESAPADEPSPFAMFDDLFPPALFPPAPRAPVDVFEELARLPDPVPLADAGAPLPDLLAPQPVPEHLVELVDPEELPYLGTGLGFSAAARDRAADEPAPAPVNGYDAPPIDVVLRETTDAWVAAQNRTTRTAARTTDSTPVWETIDDWVPDDGTDPTSGPRFAEPLPAGTAGGWGTVGGWEPTDHTGAWDHDAHPDAVRTGFYVDWGDEADTNSDGEATDPFASLATPSSRLPAEPVQAEPVQAELVEDEPVEDEIEDRPFEDSPAAVEDWPATVEPDPVEPDPVEPDPVEPDPVEQVLDVTGRPVSVEDLTVTELRDTLPPISWRATPALGAGPAVASSDPSEGDGTLQLVDDDPAHESATEDFLVAGPDWELGNAVPIVEVRSAGGLVMRPSDERWALADVLAIGDFVVEVDAEFRSGPGVGVLFRASLDDAGAMSGYSFDVDPVHEGGAFLVRQWHANRELWNPIACVPTDPAGLHGHLRVRVEVVDDRLVAQVNGDEVLVVDDLRRASAERGRAPADGDRVGIQAWSSSDLEVEELRVAAR